jgi:hypothetical protein
VRHPAIIVVPAVSGKASARGGLPRERGDKWSVTGTPQYSGDYYAVFFEDPDGMKLELVHAPGWI